MKTNYIKNGGYTLMFISLLTSFTIGYAKSHNTFLFDGSLLVEVLVAGIVVFVSTVGFVLLVVGLALDKE